MRKLIMLLFVSAACGGVLFGAEYCELGGRTRAFIIKEVSTCLWDSDIAILYSRSDEAASSEDLIPLQFVNLFNVGHYRKIAVLKGRDRLKYFSDVYTYKPDIPSNTPWHELYGSFGSRLGGAFLGDNQFRVMFIRKRSGINKAEADRGEYTEILTKFLMQHDPEYKFHPPDFLSDFDKLNGPAYLEKYGLSKAFDVAVYDITTIVSFMFGENVNMTALANQAGDKKMAEYKRPNLEWMKEDERFLIKLSKRELSELVCIAYVCDDDSGGIEAYNEAQRKSPQFLVPLSEPVEFKTELGRKIHQKITTGHVEEDAEFDRLDW